MATTSARSSRAHPGAAGAGTGTITVAIANALPVHSTLRTVLLYAAPSISVVAGWLAVVLDSQVNHYQRRFVYKRAKKALRAAINNPDAGEAFKTEMQADLESLEKRYAASETAAAAKIFRAAGRR